MDTSLTDDASIGPPRMLRLLVLAGALFGFSLLAMALSGTAHASDGAPPPERPGLLDRAGDTAHGLLKPVEPALEPVTGTVHAVSSRVASAVEPVTSGLEPVLAPVARPVLAAAEPVLSALRPVTRPVLHAVSPVTAPVLHATAPVTAPVVRAIGGRRVVPAVTGHPVAGNAAAPAPRDDIGAPPVVDTVAVFGAQAALTRPAAQRLEETPAVRRFAGRAGPAEAGVAAPMSGSGGGLPVGSSGTGGAMSAGTGSAHGGEFAVTASGAFMPGTDRAWRPPPGGRASPYWLVFYGNDHPS
ncbi:hypothetical protein [Amycolatopsis sp. lyj-23]|uniref:hypothetical protein n=1 Tax=Amycolatopsis sp. lyj-23 TaxID=2789283 RepID=UPI00397B936B